MEITSDDSRHDLLGPEDDDFHDPAAYTHLFESTNNRWFHETAWFSWFVPEEKIGGWLYNWVRPNIGTSGGGVWVWDDSAFSHLEVPYYTCYQNQAFEPGGDLRRYRFPSGTTVECLEPLSRYRLGFEDRERISLDFDFQAVMPPWVTPPTDDAPTVVHFDQIGRVTGSLTLHGRRIDVDCLAMRDRTWAPRSERWREGRVGYVTAANTETAFLAGSAAGVRGETDERVRSGFLLREGRRAALVDGSREVQRDPEHGFVTTVTVAADDSDGRRLEATGEVVSRMAMPIPGVHGVCWTGLVDWRIGDQNAWGEDQDAWPIHGWSDFQRTRRAQQGGQR